MKRLLMLFALALGLLGATAGTPVIGAFYTTDGQGIDELPYRYVSTTYERPNASTIIINDFWQSGNDLTIHLGKAGDDGYYTHLTFDIAGGHDHYGHHYYLCADYGSITIGHDETSDSFFTDYCFYYNDAAHDELCLTYWSGTLKQWCVYVVDFRREYIPEWTGDIEFPEADTLDELLTFRLTFPHAKDIKAGPASVLGLVYDTHGAPYAIVFGSDNMPLFGNVRFYRDVATVSFAPIAQLNAELQSSAASIGARIGAFGSDEGKAKVVFASKSFEADGQLVEDIIVQQYDLHEGILTNLDSTIGNGAATNGMSTPRNASTYTLDGRRATKYNIHAGRFCIDAGRKVIK